MKKSLSLLSCNTTRKTMKSLRHTRIHGLRATLCRALLPLGLLLLAMPAFGQTYFSNANVTCAGTITRNESGHLYHYMKTGSTSGVLLTTCTPTSLGLSYSAISISGYNIQDFTIVGDTVYICGEDASGKGFYGWSTLAGFPNATWNIYKIYSSIFSYTTDVKRIRVFRSNGDLHVLLVGRYYNVLSHLNMGSIIHVKNNNQCTIAYSLIEYFDDIAVLDHYVATASRKYSNNTHPLCMRVLSKNNFSLSNGLFGYYYVWGVQETLSRIQLQNVGSDRFVSVYNNDTAFYINTYTVSSDYLHLHNYCTINTDSIPIISDIAYNDADKTIEILYNVNNVGFASILDCNLYPYLFLDDYCYYPDFAGLLPNNAYLTSVAKKSSGEYSVTGINGNKMILWDMPNGCEMSVQNDMYKRESSISQAWDTVNKTTMTLHQQTLTSPVTTVAFTEACYTISHDGNKSDGEE